MSAKENLMHQLRCLSSGTIANFIGCSKYNIIDLASSRAILYAAALTEDECSKVQTMEDIANLFLIAWKKIR